MTPRFEDEDDVPPDTRSSALAQADGDSGDEQHGTPTDETEGQDEGETSGA